MFNIIKDTYKLYFKKMPVWVLYILPLVVYSAADDFLRDYWAGCRSYLYLSMFLSPSVFALIQLFIYKRVLAADLGKALPFAKKWIFLAVFQVVMGFVMMIPMFVLSRIAGHHHLGTAWIPLGLIANIFLGIWLFAKVSVVLPLIISGRQFTRTAFAELMKADYLSWALVAALIYFPYIACYYLIGNEYVNLLLTSLFSVLLPLFNSLYYQAKKAK